MTHIFRARKLARRGLPGASAGLGVVVVAISLLSGVTAAQA
jgi:hypothetical protein